MTTRTTRIPDRAYYTVNIQPLIQFKLDPCAVSTSDECTCQIGVAWRPRQVFSGERFLFKINIGPSYIEVDDEWDPWHYANLGADVC